MLLSLWILATLTFFMMKALPGDPFTEEKALTKEVLQNLRKEWGLDQPLSTQYIEYMKSLIRGNLGPSLVYPTHTVNDIIVNTFPVSFYLGFQAIILAVVGGILMGWLMTVLEKKWLSPLVVIFMIILSSIPSFILASLFQYFFAVQYALFPIGKWGTFGHTILPTFSLAAFPMAYIARLVNTRLREIYRSDYIRFAEARGLKKETIFFRHALPNSLVPVVAYLGQAAAAILTGSFVIEKIFGIPGLGKWYISSILNRDYPLTMGLTLFYSLLLMSIILISEILYGIIDPRIRHRRHAR